MNKTIIYFDACIWIAMFTDEQRKDISETQAIAGLIPRLDNEEIIVVASTLLIVEVLETTMNHQQKLTFERILKHKMVVQLKDPNIEIMKLAAEIRNFYKEKKKSDDTVRVLKTPDAIHLATAIYYKCPSLFTFDKGLLNVELPVMGQHAIEICKPNIEQAGLFV